MHREYPGRGFRLAGRHVWRIATQVLLTAVLGGLVTTVARADTEIVGEFSFDTVNPGATDAFTVQNFTGDNNLGLFPVSENVDFLGIGVTFTDPTGPTANGLGDLSPNPGFAQLQVLAPPADTYSQAAFQATLSQTIFTLSDGTTFQADSSTVMLTLLPSSGSALQADIDSGFITVNGSVITPPAPEPPVWLLLIGGTLCLLGIKRAMSACCLENF